MGGFLSASNASRHSVAGGGNIGGENTAEENLPLKWFTKKDDQTSFTDIIQNNTRYGQLFETQARYEVYVNHRGNHWYMILKLENSGFPYLTLEIVTTDGHTLQPFVCEQTEDLGKEHVTATEGNMHEFCSLADTFIKEMRRYDPRNKNSQHFCNAFLGSLNRPPIEATVGPNIPDGFSVNNNTAASMAAGDNFDYLDTVCESLPNRWQSQD